MGKEEGDRLALITALGSVEGRRIHAMALAEIHCTTLKMVQIIGAAGILRNVDEIQVFSTAVQAQFQRLVAE